MGRAIGRYARYALSWLLSVALVLMLTPVSAMAADADTGASVGSSEVKAINSGDKVSTEVYIKTKMSFALVAINYSMYLEDYDAGKEMFCLGVGGDEPYAEVVWTYAPAPESGGAPADDAYTECASYTGKTGTYEDASGNVLPKFSITPKNMTFDPALKTDKTYYFKCSVTDAAGKVAEIDKPIQLVLSNEYRPGPLDSQETPDPYFTVYGKNYKEGETKSEGMFHREVWLADTELADTNYAYREISSAAAKEMPAQEIKGVWQVALTDAPEGKDAYTGGPISMTLNTAAFTAAGVDPDKATIWWFDTANGAAPVQVKGTPDGKGGVTFEFEPNKQGEFGVIAIGSTPEDVPPGIRTSYTVTPNVIADENGAIGGQVSPSDPQTYVTAPSVVPEFDLRADPHYKVKSVVLKTAGLELDITDCVTDNSKCVFPVSWWGEDCMDLTGKLTPEQLNAWNGDVQMDVRFEYVADDKGDTRTLSIEVADDCGNQNNNVVVKVEGVAQPTIVTKNAPAKMTFDSAVSVNMTFSAAAGYGMVNLEMLDGAEWKSVAKNVSGYAIGALEHDATYRVTFGEALIPPAQKHNVTASVKGEGGTVDPVLQTVAHGEIASIKFAPAEGFELAHVWVRGADMIGAVTGNIFNTPRVYGDTDVLFEFASSKTPPNPGEDDKVQYSVYTSWGEHGHATPTTKVTEGGSVTVSFFPDKGYGVDTVLVDGVKADYDTRELSVTFDNLQTDKLVYVTFKPVSDGGNGGDKDDAARFTITPSHGVGGGISPAVETDVYEGESQRFNFFPALGYKVSSVQIDGAENAQAVADGFYEFANVSADHTIHVEFKRTETEEPNLYRVNLTVSGGGWMKPEGVVYVDVGGSIEVKVGPDSGYKLLSLFVDTDIYDDEEPFDILTSKSRMVRAGGTEVSYDSTTRTLRFSNVSSDMLASGIYQRTGTTPDSSSSSSSSGSSSASSSSSGSGSGSSSASGGGHHGGSWGDPTRGEDPNSWYYTLNAKAIGKGTVNDEATKTVRVKENSDYTFKLTPHVGYQLLSVKDNNVAPRSGLTSQAYTLYNVSSDHNIEFAFGTTAYPGANDPAARTIRRLQALARTGDMAVPGAMALVSLACAGIGVALVANNRRRKQADEE